MCVRVKRDESEQFRIDSGVRQGSLAFQCICGCSDERGKNGDRKEGGRKWRLPSLLYEDDLVLCVSWRRTCRWWWVGLLELCRRRGLKVNGGKSKVMVMNGEEGSERVAHLEHVSEFKYLGCFLDKAGTDGAECSRKEEGGSCHQVSS